MHSSRKFVIILLASFVTALSGWTLSTLPALAGPPAPIVVTITQPDGLTTFEARLWGDEHLNGVETVGGYTIVQDSNSGYWVYAELDPNTKQLKATGLRVGQTAPPVAARGARPVRVGPQGQPMAQGPAGVSSVPVLILLVQYNNQSGSTSEADWIDTFFGTTNSVKDFYLEVSYNQFTLTRATEACGLTANDGLTGWMTIGTTHPNAGGPSIARAALNAADACVNYASFDNNNDEQITADELLPMVIVAGYEQSYAGTFSLGPNIWGHQGSVNYRSVSDGVTIIPYGQFGERHAATWDTPGHRATLGLIVHEIGHLLGWPDLYDTLPPGNPDSEGVGVWSVMGSGLWLGATYLGDTPAHPSAWEKWYQGWLAPLQLQGNDLDQTIPRVEDNKNNSVIQLGENPNGVDWQFGNASGTGEYFLVENRHKVGYDAQLPGCGLLIWHIDESVTFNNWANGNEDHKLVDLEEADGLGHLDHQVNRGDAGDPYPGVSNNTIFNITSVPNSRLYNNQASGILITNISSGCADIKTATFTTTAPPNFTISITPIPNPITETTSAIIYTITINNIGEGDATGVMITNTIPISSSYVPDTASHGGYETPPGSGVITWPSTIVPALSSVTRAFRVTLNTTLTNGAELVNIIALNSDQGINISNFEQVEIVGIQRLYLPVVIKE